MFLCPFYFCSFFILGDDMARVDIDHVQAAADDERLLLDVIAMFAN